MHEIADVRIRAEERVSLTIEEICQRHRLSLATVYREMHAGRLRSFTVGTARRVSVEAEREWVEQRETAASDFRPLRRPPPPVPPAQRKRRAST